MPHLTLEYSSNIKVDSEFADLFQQLHDMLADALGTRIDNCKSRAYEARNFRIGTGEAEHAFVHLDIRLLEGRSTELKHAVGKTVCDVLVEWFKASTAGLEVQITVEVKDIERATYSKYPEGTLTPI